MNQKYDPPGFCDPIWIKIENFTPAMNSSSHKRTGGPSAAGQTSDEFGKCATFPPGHFPNSASRPVALWVYAGGVMPLIQGILGGITRLAGSGLSITEWNVVTGTLPPLNTAQ